MADLFRIALATPPFAGSVDGAMEHVEKFMREASERGARIVCFPESYVPGYRGDDEPGEPVEPHSAAKLEMALERTRELARRYNIAVVLPMDWDHPDGIGNVAMVVSEKGEVLGQQAKNQLDPTEDTVYVAGVGRQVFEIPGLKFGVVICHEGFRYPESVRWAARRGASIVFHPHCTGSNKKGRRLSEWRSRDNPYYEQAMMCRALENTIFFAGVNYGFRNQDSASSVFGPQGEGIAYQPYGEAGVLVVDIDLALATGRLASRFAERSYQQG